MKSELFVTAGEVAQELGVSKPFGYNNDTVRNLTGEYKKIEKSLG